MVWFFMPKPLCKILFVLQKFNFIVSFDLLKGNIVCQKKFIRTMDSSLMNISLS